ncbi:hypothetical protein HDU76_005312 [Blyttiomyces sp. JEL0837]|nr:hypothetical protein HDU76_005312 [Blyttiomyces sp. JEL0837]
MARLKRSTVEHLMFKSYPTHRIASETLRISKAYINSNSNSSAKHSRRASTVDADKGLILSAQATAPTPIFQKTVLERLSTWSILSSSTTASASIPAAILVDGCSTCGRIGPTKHHFKISEYADDTWCPIIWNCRQLSADRGVRWNTLRACKYVRN